MIYDNRCKSVHKPKVTKSKSENDIKPAVCLYSCESLDLTIASLPQAMPIISPL